MTAPAKYLRLDFLLLGLVGIGFGWTLSFAYSPEDWVGFLSLRERSLGEALLPVETYPYYRPLWWLWLWFCEQAQLPPWLGRLLPLAAHFIGGLAVLRIAKVFGASSRFAFATAALLLLAPGTISALSWFAAGNKSLTFCFLSLGVLSIATGRSILHQLAGAVLFGSLAIGAAENAYMQVLLFPFFALVAPSKHSRQQRSTSATAIFVMSFALSYVHLRLLPQYSTPNPAETRTAELLAAISAGPIEWSGSVVQNLGRYFAHGLGIEYAGSRIGIIFLVASLIFGLLQKGRRWILSAILVFVILNIPASLFPEESHRHHGYLPALGALLVIASLLRGFSGILASRLCMALAVLFLPLLWLGAAPWSAYCAKAETMLVSARDALPKIPEVAPTLLNLPYEYRAAFEYVHGKDCGAATWPGVTLLSTRNEILLPQSQAIPKDEASLVLEYDGQRVCRTSWSIVRQRKRSAPAWLLGHLDPYPEPYLAWSNILSSEQPLSRLTWSQTPSERKDSPVPEGRVHILEHGLKPGPMIEWKVEVELASPAWLVLGWWPAAVPSTHNVGVFTIEPLPWAFEVEVRDVVQEKKLSIPIRPCLGFLPAVRLPKGKRSLQVTLRLRS
ncbi:MAG: hypothetical protein CSA62_14290 [Planctomycetota bacterium]|nr:MAG: hypothetical protein CSA62_14290 [Planctomycetota bacterium]